MKHIKLFEEFAAQNAVDEAYAGNISDFKYDLEMAIEELGFSSKAVKQVSKKGKGYEVRMSSYMSQRNAWEKIAEIIGATLVDFKADPKSINVGVYEAFKKEYGKSLTLSEFKELKPGSEVLYRGAKFEIEENNGVTLVLKGERRNLSVNFSMFNEGGALLEATEVSEARSINRIQDEWTKHTSKMKETAAEWKEASGKAKDSLLAKLKEMTQKKKEIERELYDAISVKDKDLELALESLVIDEALSPEDKRALRGEMILGQRSDEKAEDLKEVIGKEFSDNFSSTLRSKLVDVKKGPRGWYAVVQEVPSPYSSVKNKPKAGTREDHIFRVWNSFFF
jgi:hypothetical protein